MGQKKAFDWGVATAAYQIEGAWNADGKSPSIWDTFTHAGKSFRGQTGDAACEHYTRFREDVRLMAELGVTSYRFSVSWARVLRDGTGEINEKGLQFYSDLVDELLRRNIKPFVTLYHWDMPQSVYEQGGFSDRKIVSLFARYVTAVVEKLGDRVKDFVTINEPQCVLHGGLFSDALAPGVRLSVRELLQCAHNLLLCHGEAVRILREKVKDVKIGIALCGWVSCPLYPTEENERVAYRDFFAVRRDEPMNCMSVLGDAVYLGDYPREYYEYFRDVLPDIREGDLQSISRPLDYVCQNIYSGMRIGPDGKYARWPDGSPQNSFGWDDLPECVYWCLKFLYRRYSLPVVITENGVAQNDRVCLDGKVHDCYRIDGTARFLSEMKRAAAEGVPVRGYYHWSLLDNFEWKAGFSQRFGLVYVDYATQKRIKKDSFAFYRQVIATDGACIAAGQAPAGQGCSARQGGLSKRSAMPKGEGR